MGDKPFMAHFMRIQREMKDSIEALRRRAADRHSQTLSASDAMKAAEYRGAIWALDDESRRLQSALGLRPDWEERLDPIGEMQEPYRIQPKIVDDIGTVNPFPKRGRRAG